MNCSSDFKLPDMFINPDYDNSRIMVSFTAPSGCSDLTWEIIDKNQVINQGKCNKSADKVTFTADVPDFIPWNVDFPYLYILQIRVDPNLEQSSVVSRNFGMRKIQATSDTILVNNEPFCVRGYIRGRRAHEHPNLCGLTAEEYYAKNFRQAKKYGFNLVRFHSTVPPRECFDAADKAGIFIHVEGRPYFGLYQKEERAKMLEEYGDAISDKEWIEIITNHRNHPSLMVYCIGNEIRNPGLKPRIAEIAELTKKYDSTRLFLDTCAHGEFDRDNVDIDVQHMSYFYPCGKNYDMFENTYNWFIYGSVKGLPMETTIENDGLSVTATRCLDARRPILAHEICHYIALHDLDELEKKHIVYGAKKPWWIDELKKLIEEKGLKSDYPQMLKASRLFQSISWKLAFEAARRSSLLAGYHFLQLADTDRYENSNGIIDYFDDDKNTDPEDFRKINGATVILADLPRRTYFEKETINIPVLISHFLSDFKGMADFRFVLSSSDGANTVAEGKLDQIDMRKLGRRQICRLKIQLPEVNEAEELHLTLTLAGCDESSYEFENQWSLWVYPNKPQHLNAADCTIDLDDINITARYPQLASTGSVDAPCGLLIVNRFSEYVFDHLANGGDVWCMYRIPETRDRLVPAEKETYYLPATWDRFKGVIWDRGTNCGAFIRPNRAFDDFPNNGYMDLQFHDLIHDCDKIVLDDFPCEIEPIMQGVDKAVRDRYDVKKYHLSEFQPDWTFRKFAYVFEIRAGKGRLFVTGFNFTGLNHGVPASCAMFESVFRYITGDAFAPSATMSVEQLKTYLADKAKEPRIKERQMTQFWQLDSEPLESAQYWKDAEDYLTNN